MTSGPLRARPGRAYESVGDGEHSEVFRRPGSRYCVQLFRTDCPELTVTKIRDEYTYLRRTYAELPELVPLQRLFAAAPDVHVSETVLVKQWVEVDTARPLNRARRGDLPPGSTAQLERFVAVTRGLLQRAGAEETLLPDIIDHRFRNLALDVRGNLRLLDTNRLINTRALRALAPGQHLDITRRPIHAAFLRRLMYLDAAFRRRDAAQLAADPVYSRYLCPPDLHTLLRHSADIGEAI